MIIDLRLKDVPVFFPAGNSGDKSRIDWPACISGSFAIGALDTNNQIASYSNYDPILNDFYVLGTSQALLPENSESKTRNEISRHLKAL